jgi:hypothetical protein
MSWFGKKISVAAALAGTSLTLPALAQTITDDPLQGFCFQAAPLCQDGGAFTPLRQMTGANSFGFDSKPQTTTETYFVDFLIPDDKGLQTITVSATQTGYANTRYTSQIDPGFNGGYFVYEVDLRSSQVIKDSQCITQSPNSVLAVGC